MNCKSRTPIITTTLKILLPALLGGLTTSAFAEQTDNEKTLSSKQQYFRHIMFRETPYASYRGIHQLQANTNPGVAHYEFNYDQQGRVTEISYQINDTLIRGNEVWDSFIWFAPKVKIDYHSDKEIHTYFDYKNQQIAAHGDVFKAEYQLDNKGHRTSLNFFDKEGNPSESAWNIHRYEWRFKNDKVYEKRFNLKNQQQPMRPVLNFYEVELEYDADGKLAFMRNLGLEGKPTNNDSGAGIDRVVYDQHGNFVRWQVYDKDGNPVEGNRPMVHVGEHLYDQYGNKVGMRGFDRSGKRIPFSWGSFEHVQTFNQYGHQREHIMYNVDGSLDRHLFFEYDEDRSRISWLKSLNEQGELAATPMLGGAAALKYVYQQDGSVKREQFNADLTKFTPPTRGSAN